MTRALWFELLALTCLVAVLAAAVILSAGEWAWSWDALNHHIYLGMIAESPRWQLDVLAASAQGYQYPYLYWPVYRISLLPLSGAQSGAIWSAFQAMLLLPPVWLASRYLLPPQGSATQAIFERIAACMLAASSLVVLAAITTTANDPIASVPLLWAFAIMVTPQPVSGRRAAWAAALWGVSAAFKWSNCLALPLLLLWWWNGERPGLGLRRAALMALAATAGFVVAYAPWGWQLWRHTGNPFHPHFSGLFGG
jgi:hypothetical protein